MDISAVVVVVVLIVLSLGAIVWMEIHSRKTSSKEYHRDAKRSELNEEDIPAHYSSFLTLRLNGAASSKTRAKEKE
jgi:hypothetical protein